METKEIDINNLPEGWRVEEGRNKSKLTGKKRIFILDSENKCVVASCGKCGAILGAENFNKGGSKYNKQPYCKKCCSEYSQEHYKNNGEYYVSKNKTYYKNNITKIKEKDKKYRENNKEKIKERGKGYRENNKEKARKYSKDWYERNKENKLFKNKQWFMNNEKRHKELQRLWRLKNPKKCKAIIHKYRTQKVGNGGFYTTDQLNHCLRFFNGCCAYTGEVLNKYDLDHIKPISKGGTSFIYNLVPATVTANRSKGAKDLISWYKEQPYYSPERLNKILEWQKLAYELYIEQQEQQGA